MKPSDTPIEEMPTRTSGVRDYQRVARAIDYLRRHAGEQPPLAVVARHVHLSEHHFQRMFTRWAGVSPKRFLQFLTVEHAKARLAAQPDVAALADDSGLSGAGRLHDLFVTLEAMSPGEFKAGGAGLAIRYGLHASPFGPCLIATTARGICRLEFLDDADEKLAADLLQEEWPRARIEPHVTLTASIARRVFTPLENDPGPPLALRVKGTNFQVKVWRALLGIPSGGAATYSAIARAIGQPAAARAVGNAIGANPIAYLIPCHRVLRESGALGGYRWGESRKAAILGWEAARAASAPQ